MVPDASGAAAVQSATVTEAMGRRRPVLGGIADDFTGAADLCNTLVREGMRTVQTIGPAPDVDVPEVDAVVVALKSRTAPVAEAVRDARQALSWLRSLGVEQFFFKYCSTFDSTPEGNIGPVADALLDDVGLEFTVVCPAIPSNGRTLYQGHLFVNGVLLSESSMAHHPLTPMTDANIVRFFRRQTTRSVALVPYRIVREGTDAIARKIEELRQVGVSYAVVDALEEAHLRAIGVACASLPLVTGGSGLAVGLPANFRALGLLPPQADFVADDLPEGPAIVLAGSCSGATRDQVRRMAEFYPAVKVTAGDEPAVADAAVSRLDEGPILIYSTAAPDEVSKVQQRFGAASAGPLLEALFGEIARRAVAAGARRIIIAGGETSAAVVSALGVRALTVGDEIAPGVPWMISIGDFTLAIALKSGNFGGPNFFLEALGLAEPAGAAS